MAGILLPIVLAVLAAVAYVRPWKVDTATRTRLDRVLLGFLALIGVWIVGLLATQAYADLVAAPATLDALSTLGSFVTALVTPVAVVVCILAFTSR